MAETIKIPIELQLEKIGQNQADLTKFISNIDKNISQLTQSISSLSKSFIKDSNAIINSSSELSKNIDSSYTGINETITKTSAESSEQLSTLSKAIGGLSLAAAIINSEKVVSFVDSITKGLPGVNSVIKATISGITSLSDELIIALNNISSKGISSFIDVVSNVFVKGLQSAQRSINEFSVAIKSFGPLFFAFGTILSNSENQIIAFAGSVLQLIGIAISPLGVAIEFLLLKFSSLFAALGTKLVNANLSAYKSFVELDSIVFTFNRTLANYSAEYPELIKNSNEFNDTIKTLKSVGFPEKDVRAATAEFVAAGTAIGLNSEQMKNLLVVSGDLAKQIKTDLVSSTLDIISGLNGNSQALIKYGFHLSEAGVQHTLLKKGIEVSLGKLSEEEKAQARLNALLSQYTPIAGLAEAQKTTSAGAASILTSKLTDLNNQYARGVAVIEDISIAQRAFAAVIDFLNPTLVSVAGFFGALTARIIQGIGIFGQAIVAISLLTSGMKSLDIILQSNLFNKIINADIPLFNKSIIELAKNVGVSATSFTNAKDLFKAFGLLLVNQSKVIIGSILSIEAASVSFSTVFTRSMSIATLAFIRFSTAILTNPIVLGIAAISLAFYVLVNVFSELEKQTKAISTVFQVFKATFDTIYTSILGNISAFKALKEILSTSFFTVFGASIAGASFLLDKFIKLIGLLPDSIISKESKKELQQASNELVNLNNNLSKVGYNLALLENNSEGANRSVAGIKKEFKFTSEQVKETTDKLKDLSKELENAGLTDLEKIKKNEQDRLKIIKDAVNQGVITREKAAGLIAKTEIEFSQKTHEAQKKLTEEGVKDREKALQASQKRANAFLKFDLFEIVEEIKLKATLDAADIVNFAAGFASQLKRGAEGAVDVLAQGAGIIAEQFLPGIGKAVTELFKFLAQGAAKIREQILSFVKAIPDILFAVAEALQALPNILLEAAFAFVFTLIEKLPEFVGRFFDSILNGIQFLLNAVPQLILALVQQIPQVITALVAKVGDFMLALVNNLPIFIQGLVDAIPQIIQTFIDGTPLIVSSLIEQMPAIAVALAKAIVVQLPVALFKVLVSVLEKTFFFIRDNLVKAFNTIFDPIINFFKNLLGGEDGFIPDSVPLIGRFATGGVVPEGFPNDTYPAGLTSGELVIPKEDVSNLRSFLNSEKSASPARESVTNNNNDSLMLAILKTLQNIESKTGSEEIVVNVGGKQLISTIRENLKSGRVLA